MNIADFHQQAASVFKGAWVKTSVELCTGDDAPRFIVTVRDGEDDWASAEDRVPAEAIRKCRFKLHEQRENKHQAARKLLGMEE